MAELPVAAAAALLPRNTKISAVPKFCSMAWLLPVGVCLHCEKLRESFLTSLGGIVELVVGVILLALAKL